MEPAGHNRQRAFGPRVDRNAIVSVQPRERAIGDYRRRCDHHERAVGVPTRIAHSACGEYDGAFVREHGRNGIPLYVMYPGNLSGTPTLLPQLLTANIVTEALASVSR